eukprot:TRINITY_DN1894_c0_g2_i5.p1 TRINITY_DN1894_c0_g2~~TRINITY_DN1894_c0_g2_i5.p1  ORF type:complete len:400 (-),score=89.99 TRINITY_DN1894_c0_g2_i5:75-1274(-)
MGDHSAFRPVSGKYTLIELDHDPDDAAEMEDALEVLSKTKSSIVQKIKPCTLPVATQELLKIIFDHDMFKTQMAKMNIDVNKMPLGKLSVAQVDRGHAALDEIEKALKKPRSDSLPELSSRFYTVIPHSFGRSRPPVIDSAEALQQKRDMLAVLSDIVLAQKLAKEVAETEGKESVVEVEHPIDKKYQQLHCSVTPLDQEGETYEIIEQYLSATSQRTGRKLKLLEVFEVNREGETNRFAAHRALKNRKLLWHGTNVAVVVAILSSGLRIMPHSGGRVGKGIYFASENSKSAGYVRPTADGIGFMFLNEVALGKEFHIKQDDPSLVKAPSGYDSIVAKGWNEPDPKKDKIINIAGNEVIVPQGEPVPQPEWNTSSFSQSEYLIYKESQNHMRYLLKIKF